MWRETYEYCVENVSAVISIHSLRVEGDTEITGMEQELEISIHSLRVEGDPRILSLRSVPTISIHSLRVEGDDTENMD